MTTGRIAVCFLEYLVITFFISVGSYIFQDEENAKEGRPLEHGIIEILKGSSRYFPIVVVDRGYDILPKNVKKDRISKYSFNWIVLWLFYMVYLLQGL